MPRVCVVGSANLDYTMAMPRLPRAGETVAGGALVVNHGGKGANQAMAARLLGAEVQMIGCVGQDDAGARVRQRLAQFGIGVDGLTSLADVATGTALILVDPDGRNQIGVALGANDRLTVEMAQAHEASIAWADVLLCQLETPLAVARWALECAKRHGVTTILNPAPAQPLTDELLSLVDFLTPNETEVQILSGLEVREVESAREAAQHLLTRGAHQVIVTLGEHGALACDQAAALHFPAFPVTVVDTTAAGDAFSGALAVGIANGGTLEQVIPLAAAAAALTCTKRGAQDSLPHGKDVGRFLQSQQG